MNSRSNVFSLFWVVVLEPSLSYACRPSIIDATLPGRYLKDENHDGVSYQRLVAYRKVKYFGRWAGEERIPNLFSSHNDEG